jgi:hypothetical protein
MSIATTGVVAHEDPGAWLQRGRAQMPISPTEPPQPSERRRGLTEALDLKHNVAAFLDRWPPPALLLASSAERATGPQ